MKQLLTLILAITFLSLYSCKKEENTDNTNPVDGGNDSTEVEDTIKTFDSTQIKIDEKYANVNWEELNLTDTCVIDICFDCGDLDRTNQAFYQELQTAFETDCPACLTKTLASWNSYTNGGIPDNENDTIQEIYKLFEAFYIAELDKENNNQPTKDPLYVLMDFNNPIDIRYDFDYDVEITDNETTYEFLPRAQFGNIKFLDDNYFKDARSCYSLNITQRDNGVLPESLTVFTNKKKYFLENSYYDYLTCHEMGCHTFIDGEITGINFYSNGKEISKAKLNLFHGDYPTTENWAKDVNGNWVKEETENKF